MLKKKQKTMASPLLLWRINHVCNNTVSLAQQASRAVAELAVTAQILSACVDVVHLIKSILQNIL